MLYTSLLEGASQAGETRSWEELDEPFVEDDTVPTDEELARFMAGDEEELRETAWEMFDDGNPPELDIEHGLDGNDGIFVEDEGEE